MTGQENSTGQKAGGKPADATAAPQPKGSKVTRSKARMTFQKWESYTVWPMFVLSVVFVACTAFVISPPKDMSVQARIWAVATAGFLWILFAVDYAIRLALSENRKQFAKSQSFELLTLLIPYLRPFLLIRYVWQLSAFRHQGADGLRRRALMAITIFALSYVYTISTVIWVVERNHPKANLVTWGDSIWWGFVTISTVGYGVYYPVTTLGRALAILMMLGGMFVIGVISATVISSFNSAMTSFLADAAPKSKEESVAHGRAMVEALSMGALQVPPKTQADDQSGTTQDGPGSQQSGVQ